MITVNLRELPRLSASGPPRALRMVAGAAALSKVNMSLPASLWRVNRDRPMLAGGSAPERRHRPADGTGACRFVLLVRPSTIFGVDDSDNQFRKSSDQGRPRLR